ncbi:MAG: DUF6449 domain-containing protein [Eubacteriales bacterium]|nr:DUF6449 domain-containing protein [Eubacteriales bacterium]
MTSRMSFVRLLKEDVKRRGWLVLVSFLVLFLMQPVDLLLSMDTQMNLLAEQEVVLQDVRQEYLAFVSFGNYAFVTLFLGFLAMASGISGFSYIHSKEKLDFYHSLPVKRNRWFQIQYLSGIVIVAVPYLLSVLACIPIGEFYGLLRQGDIGTILEAYIVHMLYYLVYYGVAVLAAVLTGRVIVSALAFPVLMFLGPLYMFLVVGLASTFFSTYGWMEHLENGWWKFLSPGGLCLDVEQGMADCQSGGAFPGFRMILLILAVLALVGVDLLIFKRRKSEMAGHSLAFPKLEAPVKVLMVVPASVGVGLFVSVVTHQNQDIWFFGGIVFSVIFFCALVEFIYHTDIREIFKPGIPFVVSLTLSLVLACAFRFDWFSYDRYLPGEDEIQAMSIYNGNLNARGRYQEQAKTIVWGDGSREILEMTPLTDFAPIYELAKNGVEKAEAEDESGTRIYVMYQLKDGRNVFRKYWVDDQAYANAQQELFEDENYKKNLYAIYQAPEEGYQSLELSTLYGYTDIVRLSQSQREEFLAAYKEELMTATYEEVVGDGLIAQLTFYYGADNDDVTADSSYPILKSFTKTLAVLEKLGLEIPEEISPEDVDSAEVYGIVSSTSYDDWDSGNTITEEISSGNKLFTDAEDVETIVNGLDYSDNTVVSYSRYGEGRKEDYYSIYISFKDSQQFVSFYLGEDEVPDCIRRAFDS